MNSKCPQRGTWGTTAVRISLGASFGPAIMYIRRLVGAWFSRVFRSPELAARIDAQWSASLERVKKGWNLVRGPLAAFQASIMDIGWSCPSISSLVEPNGDEWALQDAGTAPPSCLLDALEATVEASSWERAARHLDGLGSEAGVWWQHDV